MPDALFLDYAISNPNSTDQSAPVGAETVILRLTQNAAEIHRARVQSFLDMLIKLNSADLRAVEAVASRLVNAEADEATKTIDELLADDNRRIRDRFVAELMPLRREDAVRLAERHASDGESRVAQWLTDGTLFSVEHHGQEYFPAFQFANGLPHPTVKSILSILPSDLSDWQRAFWFVSANGWVHNRAPCEHLDEPALVIQAARYEGEPVIG